MMIIGIDPGTTQSGICYVDYDYTLISAAKQQNEETAKELEMILSTDTVICEDITLYQTAKSDLVETAYWIGEYRRICKQINAPFHLVHRQSYIAAICGSIQKGVDKDAALRQALINRFGAPHCKPLSGATDKRSAYAVTVWWLDNLRQAK